MHDEFCFDLKATVPLVLDRTEIAQMDAIAEVRVVTEHGDRWNEVTGWRVKMEDGSTVQLSQHLNPSPKAWLYACCKAYENDKHFKQCVEDEIVSKCGRLPDPNAEHRLTQRDFV